MKRNFFFRTKNVEKYIMTQDVLKNPLIGFAPNAAFLSEVADSNLVYVGITMRELEPEENLFDFETIEEVNHINRWRKEGKHAVFRLICDYPGSEKHLDIPDWLFDKTGGNGAFYDNAYGKGYSPDYADPDFIDCHKRAVDALGKRYGNDTFISYIELGSLGHWGEWHIHEGNDLPPIPPERIRSQYVLPYKDAFPNARILMRRPFKTAEDNNFGLYNDMVGHGESNRQWLEWIEAGGVYEQTDEKFALVPMTEYWKTAPAGGEFTSFIPMSQLLTTNLESTVSMLAQSHTSFLGPKVPKAYEGENNRYKKGIKEVLHSTGYRIGITKSVCSESFSSTVKLKLTWENDGVAPIYWNWPVYLYLFEQDKGVTDKIKVDINLTELLPGKKMKSVTEFQIINEQKKVTKVYVGIEDPMTNNPAVKLASSQESIGNLSLIATLKSK